jgi:uncharacterized repeat protein (TIGR02543 family)
MPKVTSKQRPIEAIVKKNTTWWNQSFVTVEKAEVKTWHIIFVFAFIAGMVSSAAWMASSKIGNYSSAAYTPPASTSTQQFTINYPAASATSIAGKGTVAFSSLFSGYRSLGVTGGSFYSPTNDLVTLIPIAKPGYYFAGWGGDCATANTGSCGNNQDKVCVLQMNSPKNVISYFNPIVSTATPTYLTLTQTPANSGFFTYEYTGLNGGYSTSGGNITIPADVSFLRVGYVALGKNSIASFSTSSCIAGTILSTSSSIMCNIKLGGYQSVNVTSNVPTTTTANLILLQSPGSNGVFQYNYTYGASSFGSQVASGTYAIPTAATNVNVQFIANPNFRIDSFSTSSCTNVLATTSLISCNLVLGSSTTIKVVTSSSTPSYKLSVYASSTRGMINIKTDKGLNVITSQYAASLSANTVVTLTQMSTSTVNFFGWGGDCANFATSSTCVINGLKKDTTVFGFFQ